jgi:HPt (histidine-containing phosphotransfer) domain-containing protein
VPLENTTKRASGVGIVCDMDRKFGCDQGARGHGKRRVGKMSVLCNFNGTGTVDGANEALDRAHLARQTLGDACLEREILVLFRRQSGAMMQRLLETREAEERRVAAHTLKGSARAIGAWRVAAAAEAIESNAGGADLDSLAGALGEANQTIATILAA